MPPAAVVLCGLLGAATAWRPPSRSPWRTWWRPSPTGPTNRWPRSSRWSKASHFLDSASLDWQRSWQCFTCHTNISYLIARPTIAADAPAHRQVRKFAEELISLRWEEVGPRSDAEVVAIAAALALNDAATTRKLHPLTRTALDRMWTVQRPAGDWKWPTRCRWPPMESDEHYGVTLAAIGTGAAPDGYAQTPAARAGLAKIRTFLEDNPPTDLHHKAMVLWASTYVDGLMTAEERKACIKELLAAERPTGGWAFSTLYPWTRGDGKEQDLETSDGYGTGFVVFVLRRAGVPADDPAVARGVAWLKTPSAGQRTLVHSLAEQGQRALHQPRGERLRRDGAGRLRREVSEHPHATDDLADRGGVVGSGCRRGETARRAGTGAASRRPRPARRPPPTRRSTTPNRRR